MMNPRQMQSMMRKMGINQHDLDVSKVVISTDEGDLVFDSPQVAKVSLMGQETYQIIGTPKLHKKDAIPSLSTDDIKTVVEQTGVSEDQAREVLIKNKGDIAATILELGSTE